MVALFDQYQRASYEKYQITVCYGRDNQEVEETRIWLIEKVWSDNEVDWILKGLLETDRWIEARIRAKVATAWSQIRYKIIIQSS